MRVSVKGEIEMALTVNLRKTMSRIVERSRIKTILNIIYILLIFFLKKNKHMIRMK